MRAPAGIGPLVLRRLGSLGPFDRHLDRERRRELARLHERLDGACIMSLPLEEDVRQTSRREVVVQQVGDLELAAGRRSST